MVVGVRQGPLVQVTKFKSTMSLGVSTASTAAGGKAAKGKNTHVQFGGTFLLCPFIQPISKKIILGKK